VVTDPACDLAHGATPPAGDLRTLVAVFQSPVAAFLLHFGQDLGYRTVLVDPDPGRQSRWPWAKEVVSTLGESTVDGLTDVVVTDHDRPELGTVLRDALGLPVRWIGVMGSPRHTAPHIAALSALGVSDVDIARVHRPIGLNIGSRTPPEIAIATLAGLLADRNGRPGTFF
jgi:xanthine dehydrogenase accessory factor